MPSNIFIDIKTNGKRHLRLMDIPPDSEANQKIGKNRLYCYDDYCLIHLLSGEKECKIFRPPLDLYSIPCLEWRKGYSNTGKLQSYISYTINPESKEIYYTHSVQWHENGQISQICYYEHSICQYFDESGELVQECQESPAYSNCSTYDSKTGEWTEYKPGLTT